MGRHPDHVVAARLTDFRAPKAYGYTILPLLAQCPLPFVHLSLRRRLICCVSIMLCLHCRICDRDNGGKES